MEMTPEEEAMRMQKARNNLVWLGIFSIVMFFAALTSAYLVSAADNYWVVMELPSSFWISTVIIVASSAPMYFAVRAAKQNKSKVLASMLGVTLLMGGAFTYFQFGGWSQLLASNQALSGKISWVQGEYGTDYTIVKGGETLVLEDGIFYLPSDRARTRPLNEKLETSGNTASSYLYVLTGMHVVHLLVGLLIILFLLIRSVSGTYENGRWGVILRGARYWHFLAGLWVYLFLFLQYIH